MADPVEITQDKVTIESKKLDAWFNKWFWNAIIIFAGAFCVLTILYCWNYPKFLLEEYIEAERWGQFGDFFGGVIGTVVTFRVSCLFTRRIKNSAFLM